MTLRISLSKNDPLQTKFFCPERAIQYTSDTVTRATPFCGSMATTTVLRKDARGHYLQVGLIEWPANPHDSPAVLVGSRTVDMLKTGLYTNPEKFQGRDGEWYEWRICERRAQGTHARAFTYIATFVNAISYTLFRRKESAALFIPPEAERMLDDIVVTFIYFESRWREKERAKSCSTFGGFVC